MTQLRSSASPGVSSCGQTFVPRQRASPSFQGTVFRELSDAVKLGAKPSKFCGISSHPTMPPHAGTGPRMASGMLG